jgi:hypothetical protein
VLPDIGRAFAPRGPVCDFLLADLFHKPDNILGERTIRRAGKNTQRMMCAHESLRLLLVLRYDNIEGSKVQIANCKLQIANYTEGPDAA